MTHTQLISLALGLFGIGFCAGLIAPEITAWWKARRPRSRAVMRVYGTHGTYQVFEILTDDEIVVSDAFTIKINGNEIPT